MAYLESEETGRRRQGHRRMLETLQLGGTSEAFQCRVVRSTILWGITFQPQHCFMGYLSLNSAVYTLKAQ